MGFCCWIVHTTRTTRLQATVPKNVTAALLRPSLCSFTAPSLWGCNVTYMLHIHMHACTRTQTWGVLRDPCNQMRQKKSTGIQLEGGGGEKKKTKLNTWDDWWCHMERQRHEEREKKIEEMRRVKMGVGNGRGGEKSHQSCNHRNRFSLPIWAAIRFPVSSANAPPPAPPSLSFAAAAVAAAAVIRSLHDH